MQLNPLSPEEKKSGRLSVDEMEYIDEHARHMPADEIAAVLRRNTDTVVKHIKKYPNGYKNKGKKKRKRKSLNELKPDGVILEQVRAELTIKEYNKFKHIWRQTVKQIKHDILFTEQQQMKDWICFRIYADREAVHQKTLLVHQRELQKQLDVLENQEKRDTKEIERLRDKIMSIIADISDSQRQFQEYHKIHTDIGRDLVIKRDQRIKNSIGDKKNFIDLITMLDNDDIRDVEGREMILMDMAANNVRNKLGQNHNYADGTVDKPLFSHETLGEDDLLRPEVNNE